MIEAGSRVGLRVYRERTLPNGAPLKLFVFTREDALKATPSWPSLARISPRPRFGFTPAEQQLLEFALLDHSDRDAAAALRLSTEAVKKRWRSIYKKVSQIEAALLPPELNGSDQRRALLQSLRNNLQELRPY
jgi:DNA-binding CsgD family transcriptional regulator